MMNGINTTLCYLRRGGETLLLHRVKKEGDMNRDKWIGVGGKFLPGESPEDCLRREVMEETGLTLHGWAYRGIVTFVSDQYGTEYMHLFESWDFSGEVRDCDEGVLEWLPWAQLPKLPIWEGDKLFLRLLDSRRGRAVSTPGPVCTFHRAAAKALPAGVLMSAWEVLRKI